MFERELVETNLAVFASHRGVSYERRMWLQESFGRLHK